MKVRAYAKSLGISNGQVASLKAIGSDSRLFNTVEHLPDSWGSLYECTQLTDAQLAMVVRAANQNADT